MTERPVEAADEASDAELASEPGSEPDSEFALQRRWAQGDWPGPFLPAAEAEPSGAEMIRVISPGRWNFGPGPDFRGAQILDADGRARRGDVELHLEPRGWLEHGHNHDEAYEGLLLHLVAPKTRLHGSGQKRGGRHSEIPASTALPAATGLPPEALPARSNPPCTGLIERAGAAAVAARLERVAQRRFWRKVEAIRALIDAPSEHDGNQGGLDGERGRRDRAALIVVARALGQPHNADACERSAAAAVDESLAGGGWSAFACEMESSGWRRGRGALGSAAGCAQVLTTLVRRWSAASADAGGDVIAGPGQALQALATLPGVELAAALQIPRQLGRGRALQLAADAIYPFAAACEPANGAPHATESGRALGSAATALAHWLALPGARYQRTASLRERLNSEHSRSSIRWQHPQTQALLELEQTRCRQAACRICPLAALSFPRR